MSGAVLSCLGCWYRARGVPQGSPLLMAAFPFLWLRFTCAVFAGHTHCPCWQCSLFSVTAPLSPAGTWGAQALHTPCSWLCSFPNTAAPEPPPLLLVTMQPVLLSRQSWRRPKQVLPPCTAEFSDAACPHGPALPVCSPALASQAGPEGLQSTQLRGKALGSSYTPESGLCRTMSWPLLRGHSKGILCPPSARDQFLFISHHSLGRNRTGTNRTAEETGRNSIKRSVTSP